MPEYALDETDRKILSAYQANPDYAITELAKAVALSHTACWKRFKRLEREGYVAGRALILNPEALGYQVTVVVQVRIERHNPDMLEAFENSVLAIPRIVSCYSMSGDSDYLLRVVAKSIEDYEQFLKEVLADLPHVSALKSSFALKTVKRTTALPI